MARRRRRYTLLDFVSLSPLWTTSAGLLVAGYGWIKDDPERIHQGFAFAFTFLFCVLLVGAWLTFRWALRLVVWFHQKISF